MILPKTASLHRGNLGAITQHLKPLLENGEPLAATQRLAREETLFSK